MFNVERTNNERDTPGIYCVVDLIASTEKIISLINYLTIARHVLNFKLDQMGSLLSLLK